MFKSDLIDENDSHTDEEIISQDFIVSEKT